MIKGFENNSNLLQKNVWWQLNFVIHLHPLSQEITEQQ